MKNDVIIIGDNGDMMLPESHPKEYRKIVIINANAAKPADRFIGASPQRGDVFIKHPYLDCFVANNEDLSWNICSAIVGDLSIFAQELGARLICFSISISSKRLFSNRVEVAVKAGKSDGKANVKYKKESEQFAKLSEKRAFERDEDTLTKEEFDKAQLHYQNSTLFRYCDPLRTAESMLNGRNPESGTRSMKYSVVIDKTINLNEELAVAVTYKKLKILKANGAYTQNKKFYKHIHIEMFVNFKDLIIDKDFLPELSMN